MVDFARIRGNDEAQLVGFARSVRIDAIRAVLCYFGSFAERSLDLLQSELLQLRRIGTDIENLTAFIVTNYRMLLGIRGVDAFAGEVAFVRLAPFFFDILGQPFDSLNGMPSTLPSFASASIAFSIFAVPSSAFGGVDTFPLSVPPVFPELPELPAGALVELPSPLSPLTWLPPWLASLLGALLPELLFAGVVVFDGSSPLLLLLLQADSIRTPAINAAKASIVTDLLFFISFISIMSNFLTAFPRRAMSRKGSNH